MTKYLPSLRVHGRVTLFYILGPRAYFWREEARDFKFGLQIERKEYWHYMLKSCSIEVHLG